MKPYAPPATTTPHRLHPRDLPREQRAEQGGAGHHALFSRACPRAGQLPRPGRLRHGVRGTICILSVLNMVAVLSAPCQRMVLGRDFTLNIVVLVYLRFWMILG